MSTDRPFNHLAVIRFFLLESISKTAVTTILKSALCKKSDALLFTLSIVVQANAGSFPLPSLFFPLHLTSF